MVASLRILYASEVWGGNSHDGKVWRECDLFEKLSSGAFPPANEDGSPMTFEIMFKDGEVAQVPPLISTDAAFTLGRWGTKPFEATQNSPEVERIFDSVQVRMRPARCLLNFNTMRHAVYM
jgi:hypothetical protein